MPRALDPRIADALRKYGEDPNDARSVIWDCHGTWVVYHRAVERIAAKAGVKFDPPQILRAERDEAVILVSAEMEGRRDWDIGECLVGVNYKVSPKQAAYVYAMAMKRARDRLILKLVGLHGLLYSEEEADEFKEERPRNGNGASAPKAASTVNGQSVANDDPFGLPPLPEDEPTEARIVREIRAKIDGAKSIDAVADLMLHEDTQRALGDLTDTARNGLRGYARQRMINLGWTPPKTKYGEHK